MLGSHPRQPANHSDLERVVLVVAASTGMQGLQKWCAGGALVQAHVRIRYQASYLEG